MADAIIDVLMKMAGNVLWWFNIGLGIVSFTSNYITIQRESGKYEIVPRRIPLN